MTSDEKTWRSGQKKKSLILRSKEREMAHTAFGARKELSASLHAFKRHRRGRKHPSIA
jgi:hypothetical protein